MSGSFYHVAPTRTAPYPTPPLTISFISIWWTFVSLSFNSIWYDAVMKLCYIATYPAGCYEVIARQLKQFKVDELKIASHDISSVTFESTLSKERLIELRFFTNVFLILEEVKLASYRQLINNPGYRLMAITKGEPTQIEEHKRARLVSLIEDELKLRPNLKNPVDIVLIKRTGETEVLTLRLPRVKHKREELPAGSLRPELAHIMLLVAGVKPKETLLDPFAGHGSILLEAVRGFGLKNVIAVEQNADLAQALVGKGFQVTQDDARMLATIHDESVDRVVTDPPWGLYDDTLDVSVYEQSLAAISRVLRPRGVAAILSGSQELDQAIDGYPDFTRLKVIDVLVSGKKARLFKLQKN